MRSGILISAVSHLVLVVLALLGTPKPFDERQMPTIEVELVQPDQVPERPQEKPPEEQPPEPKPETKKESVMESVKPDKSKQAEWEPRLDPWAQNKPDQPKTEQAQPDPSKPDARPAGQPDAKPNTQQASKPAGPNQPQPTQPQPAQAQAPKGQVARTQPAQTQPTQPPPQAEQKPAETSIFDPINVTKFMDIASGMDSGFDAESTVAAKISSDDRTAFKAHLRKCWKLPASVTSQARVVLRVSLRRDGNVG